VITKGRWLVAVALFAAGCGDGSISAPRTAPVTGTVLVKGKPVAGVKVTFHPQFNMGKVKYAPSGLTDKDGRFTLTTAAPNDGAPKGEYAVTFALMRDITDARGLDSEEDVWKGKYADPANSAFKVTVVSGDNVAGPFNLE
jgi:hypothetical protein